MATGIQATTALASATETKVYEVPTGYTWYGGVSICNRNAATAKVRVAVGSNAAMSAGMYLEYELPLTAYGTSGNVLQLTGLSLATTQAVWVYSDTANVDVVVFGIEE